MEEFQKESEYLTTITCKVVNLSKSCGCKQYKTYYLETNNVEITEPRIETYYCSEHKVSEANQLEKLHKELEKQVEDSKKRYDELRLMYATFLSQNGLIKDSKIIS